MISTMGDILTQLGQVAAIILGFYLLVNILIGLAFTVVFMFAFSWVGSKAELIKKLRPTVESVNAAIKNPQGVTAMGTAPANKLVQVVHSVQAIAIPQKIEGVDHSVHEIEQKVNQGADRVASTVIEIRARTVQVQGVVKAFFLPGLTRKRKSRVEVLKAAADETQPMLIDGDASSLQLPSAREPVAALNAPVSDGNAQPSTTGFGSTGNASHT